MKYKIPYPPSTNNLYRNVPGVGRRKTKRYQTWSRAAGNEILTQKREKIAGPVHLILTVERKKGNNIDITNGMKAPEDLLVEMGLIDDDRNVVSATQRWGDETTIEVRACECPPD